MRRHSGRHLEFMKRVNHLDFLDTQESVSRKFKAGKYNLILNVCRGGKHRSEATAQLQRHVIAKKIYAGDLSKVGQCSLQCETHWQRIRPESCPECTSRAARDKRNILYQQAEGMMSELFTLPEAETKPMPRKSDPERDSKKAKTKEAASSSKGSLSNASKEIQKHLKV